MFSLFALYLEWNSPSTSIQSIIEISLGNLEFNAFGILSTGIAFSNLKLATCPNAWTPASVLPDPVSLTSSLVISWIAFSIVPCIPNESGCFCHPQ